MTVERSAPQEVGDLQERRDRRLLELIASGDEESFGELFRRYGAPALGLAARVVRDQGLAEEVLQEVFISIWKRAGTYDSARGSVRSWVMSQIHHRSVDLVRREEAERRRNTTSYVPAGDEPTPDDVVEDTWLASRREHVRAALSSLPTEHQEVLELTYYRGMTQSKAATALGIPLGTVKSRTMAAMRRLQSVLVSQGREP